MKKDQYTVLLSIERRRNKSTSEVVEEFELGTFPNEEEAQASIEEILDTCGFEAEDDDADNND